MIFMLLILFTPVIDPAYYQLQGNAISDLFVSATAFVPSSCRRSYKIVRQEEGGRLQDGTVSLYL